MAARLSVSLMANSTKRRAKLLLGSVAFVLMQLSPAQASSGNSVLGHWLTGDGKSIIQIYQCGRTICGKVAKAIVPAPLLDTKNPDPVLRAKPFVGAAVFTDMVQTGAKWKGTIYNPRDGKSYRTIVAANPNGTLNVQGCVSFICVGQTWTKARL